MAVATSAKEAEWLHAGFGKKIEVSQEQWFATRQPGRQNFLSLLVKEALK
jgi:hypothetical protein